MENEGNRVPELLEYRTMVENWAKRAYLDARAARLAAELTLLRTCSKKYDLVNEGTGFEVGSVNNQELSKLSTRETEDQRTLTTLLQEEEAALDAWTVKRVELDALQRMRDKQYVAWNGRGGLKIQRDLEAWALRKSAA